MTPETALRFLAAHQPMPPDAELPRESAEAFDAGRRALAGSNDVTGFLACLVASLLVGCSLPGGGTVQSTPEVSRLEGVFWATGPDCPYLETTSGRRQLMFEEGLNVVGDPVRLESDGRVLAIEGDRVRLVGIEPDAGGTLCGPGIPLGVVSVENLSRDLP